MSVRVAVGVSVEVGVDVMVEVRVRVGRGLGVDVGGSCCGGHGTGKPEASKQSDDCALAGFVPYAKLTAVKNERTSTRTNIFFISEREKWNIIAILFKETSKLGKLNHYYSINLIDIVVFRIPISDYRDIGEN